MKKSTQLVECFTFIPLSSALIPLFSSLVPLLSSLFILLLILGSGLVIACIVVAVLSRRQKSARGELKLEGRVALVVHALEPEGAVLVGGELWRARARNGDNIAHGQVFIVGASGHWLEVESVARDF
jgi:membrane protein implicated in regulation of membrane protease activity